MSQRKLLGAYYTPWPLARELLGLAVVRRTTGLSAHQIEGLRVLEPAMGDGVMLVAAVRALELAWVAAGGDPRRRRRFRSRLVRERISGIDVDANAAPRARARLAEATGEVAGAGALRVGDALAENSLAGAGPFDLVVGNPPWVSARVAAAGGTDRAQLRARYRSARGAYDLAAAFTERGLELLAPGGELAFVLPKALFTARYGRALREVLTTGATVDFLMDRSEGSRHFAGLGVYPVLLGARQRAPRGDHDVLVNPDSGDTIPHHMLAAAAAAGFPVGAPAAAAGQLDDRARAGVALSDIAEVFGLTAGFDAARTSGLLREADEGAVRGIPFVVSGNVLPFRLRPGSVRYQRRLWREPILVEEDSRRHARDRRCKILVAGMGLRLRATWCASAIAGGVGVFGVAPRPGVDPFLVLGCLNAAGTTGDYARRFPGKRMAGGYLAVNGHTLASLPIVPPSHASAPAIARTARTLHECGGTDSGLWQKLDRLVERALS